MVRTAAFVLARPAAEFGKRHGRDLRVEFLRLKVLLKRRQGIGKLGEQQRVLVGLAAVGVEATEGNEVHARRQAPRNERGDVAQ